MALMKNHAEKKAQWLMAFLDRSGGVLGWCKVQVLRPWDLAAALIHLAIVFRDSDQVYKQHICFAGKLLFLFSCCLGHLHGQARYAA